MLHAGAPRQLARSGDKPHKRANQQARAAEKAWKEGVALSKSGQHKAASEKFAQAVELSPGDSLYWTNYASALNKIGRWNEAVGAARKATDIDPLSLISNQLLAQLYRDRRQHEDALAVLKSLPAEVARDARHHLLTGACLSDMGRHQEAVPEFLASLTLKHDSREAYTQMGFSLAKLRQYKQAAECFRTVSILEPTLLSAALYAPHYRAWACDWDGLDEDKNRLADVIDRQHEGVDYEAISPFCLLSFSDDAELQKAISVWDMHRYAHVKPADRHDFPKRDPNARVRIGMVSCDFHHHATSMLLVEVLEKLDRSRFEVFLYSHGIDDNTDLRKRVVAAADHFIECGPMKPLEQAEVIRSDRIDILFELKGFTLDSRLATFAYRPAPIQVAWLGYPGTCGAPFIDYIIGDPIVTPMDAQPFYTENIAQMPVTYQPNDTTRTRDASRMRIECGLPENALVFGCFNQSYKYTREMFTSWCRILKRVPSSILWLLVPDEPVRQQLRLEASRRGIDPGRLYFADFEKTERHRRRLPLIDVALDTVPCGGHTTTSDTLWAGVPVVSLMGQTFASRVAGSLLNAVDLPELICTTPQEYEAKAVELATKPEQLKALRARLATARDAAPLFDSTRFARDFGQLMLRMVERQDQGLDPAPLPAEEIRA
ncbi:MAG TPA: tetratricopeptide repeat protein [Aquabacterium sp.]|nr:tetratricopeptide repeat protein [Aquabacterium sp.]